MPPGLLDFLKKNAKFLYGGGIVGAAFVGSDVKKIADADNKFKALLKTFKDFLLVKVAMAGTFSAISNAVRALVKDTGSLEAALKRLQMVQFARRTLAPFVGGYKASLSEVASLLNLTTKTPFKFESFVSAERTLRATTKGAFAGQEALKKIGDAAAASGNSIEAASEAVGSFYQSLQNGEPIQRSAEMLSQMGLITEGTANHLEHLSEAGASTVEMASALSDALEGARGGMKDMSQDAGAVADQFAKAKESAAASFGAGFTEANVQTQKNYTEALVAIAPVLRTIGELFGKVFAGVGTVASGLTAMAAKSKFVQTAIQGLSVAVVALGAAFTVIGIAAIPEFLSVFSTFIIGISAAASVKIPALAASFTALRIAIVGIGSATVIGAAVLGVAALVGGFINLGRSIESSIKSVQQLAAAHREAQTAIDAHAAAVETLADRHDVLAQSLSHVTDLQKEYNDLVEKSKEGSINPVTSLTDVLKLRTTGKALAEARRKLKEEAGKPTDILGSPERAAVLRQENERRLAREEEQLRAGISAQPGKEAELLRQRAEVLGGRAGEGQRGLEARQAVAQRVSAKEGRKTESEANLAILEASGAREKTIEREKDRLAKINANITAAGLKAPEGTAVRLDAEMRQLQHAVEAQRQATLGNTRQAARERIMAGGQVAGPDTGKVIQDLQQRSTEAAQREVDSVSLRREAQQKITEAAQLERSRAVTTLDVTRETEAVSARARGDLRKAFRLEDLGKYVHSFEQLRQVMPEAKAKELARARTEADIAEQYSQAGNVVGYLQSIGGGGGLPQQGIDMQRRMIELLSSINEHTKKMSEEETTDQADPTNPAFFF